MDVDTVRIKGVVETHEINDRADPVKPDHNVQRTSIDRMQAIHSPVLAADSSITIQGPNVASWKPERFMIVVRLSAGSLNIHVGQGRKNDYIRIDKGTIELPMPAEAITIETVGATGFYDIYFLSGLKGFNIVS